MSLDYNDYFRRLFERMNLAVKVEFRDVRVQGWRPDLNKCHDNVDYWVKQQVGSRAIRGWIFWPPLLNLYQRSTDPEAVGIRSRSPSGVLFSRGTVAALTEFATAVRAAKPVRSASREST